MNKNQQMQVLRQSIIDKNVAAVIFAGGGIIKYKYQKFYIFIDAFVKMS